MLQLTAPESGSNDHIKDPTPSPMPFEEDFFEDDVGDMSKVPTLDINDTNVEPAEQDLEDIMVSQENLLNLSAIINRDWTEAIEEDDSYIKIYPSPKIICYWLQGFTSQTAYYDPRVGVNLLLIDPVSGIDLQPLIPSTKILQW